MAAAAAALVPYRWLILVGLITAAIMEVLDTTIINVALPQMAGNLGATTQEIAWVSTSYILANVVVLPMTAFFTERFGRKRYLTFSIVLFIVASFMCGTSSSLGELVLWRLLQGAGGAALLSTAQATLRQIFPREQQGMVQAIFLLGIIVAPTLGPTLGGWITDNYTWDWCFFINLPIGLVAAFLVSTFLHDPPDQQRHTAAVDWLGIGLLIVGIGSLQYVLEEGNREDWFSSALIIRLSIISAVSLIALLWWQLSSRNEHPVIKFRVLKNRDLAASIFLFIVLGFGLYGGAFLFPLFTQTLLGFTPTETGLAMMPGGLATALFALICGCLLNGDKPKADARVLILMGMGLMLVVDVAARASHDRGGRGRRALRADHSRRGARLAVHADQQRRLRKPEASRGAAGVGLDQSLTTARRLVRHRRARDVPHAARAVPSRRSPLELLSVQPGVRRATSIAHERHGRQGRGAVRCAQSRLAIARQPIDAPSHHARLQRRMAAHPAVVSLRGAGGVSATQAARRARRGGRRALIPFGVTRPPQHDHDIPRWLSKRSSSA